MRNVAVIYHLFPHYRLPIMKALDSSEEYRFVFFGDDREYEGILPADPRAVRFFCPSRFFKLGRFFWQSAAILRAAGGNFDAVIFLANPNFLSTWIGALVARATGKKVLFWAHGWLKPEFGFKRATRNAFFRLAHVVLVYGERAKQLGTQSGFPAARIKTIYNSLDYDSAQTVTKAIRRGGAAGANPRIFFRNSDPIIICTARLTPLCELDLLLKAAKLLKDRSRPINVLLVGEGPSRPALETLAAELGLSVYFLGACYEETKLGPLIFYSDLMVQPGKMGLTVIHSLMYGTPAVTHSDLDQQMPEAEAITPGETGLLFRKGNVSDLADKIEQWLESSADREVVRQKCVSTVESKWNPVVQKNLIQEALECLF